MIVAVMHRLALLLLPLAAALLACPCAASPHGDSMAMPVGRMLAEIDPDEQGPTVLRVVRDGKVLWERESVPEAAELGRVLDDFPSAGCRTLILSGFTGVGGCCFTEAVLTTCPDLDVLSTFAPLNSALATESRSGGSVLHLEDFSLARYALDRTRSVPFADALPVSRLLVFSPGRGWHPAPAGRFARHHRLLASQLAAIPAEAGDTERAAHALAAAVHAYLASGAPADAKTTLARLLPASWMKDLARVSADVVRAADGFAPCESRVFPH